MAKNIQNKYFNNRVVEGSSYIRAEIKQQDCMEDGAKYYPFAVPAGVIIEGVKVLLTDSEDNTDIAKIKVTIGVNDCIFCEGSELDVKVGEATCSEDCKCKITDKQYVGLVEVITAPKTSGIMVLLKVLNPEDISCDSKPYKFCTETILIDPCTDDDECSCSKGC